MGPYNADVAIRCVKCAYEVDLRTFKHDSSLESQYLHATFVVEIFELIDLRLHDS